MQISYKKSTKVCKFIKNENWVLVRFLFSAHCLMLHYICIKICDHNFSGFKSLEQTQISYKKSTRAGVCKTLCPQLPDSNTVWLQHCLAMTVTTVQIYDFKVILSKGNNSKIGDDWDKKKIRITYFFMRNQNMKFQNISIHGSKLMLYTIKQRH